MAVNPPTSTLLPTARIAVSFDALQQSLKPFQRKETSGIVEVNRPGPTNSSDLVRETREAKQAAARDPRRDASTGTGGVSSRIDILV